MATDVLVVEDESIVALDLENRLQSMGFRVVGRAGTGTAALEIVGRTPPDVVLMDIQLRGDLDGISTADRIQEEHDVPVIFLTAFSDSHSLDRAKRSNAYGYLLKPFQERELSIAIELALYKHSAERELRENRALLGITLNNITEGVVTADASDRILFMNRAAEQLTGWSAEEAIGSELAAVVRTDTRILASSSTDEWAHLTPRAGQVRTVAISSNDLDRAVGRDGSRVVVIRDVSQEQEYRHSLIAAKEAAESAAQAKSDFLARVTHELRTPLNSIMGMTALLKGEPDPRSGEEYLEILDLSSQQLKVLISDVLDYARFDSGRLSLQKELFDPVLVVEQISRSFAVEAETKGLRMVTVIDPTTPRAVYGDETRFGQILRNVISNAVKFTMAGSISVTLHPVTRNRCSVSVEDTGPGVAEEHRRLIFDDFSQIESPTTRRAGGVGLGLALVRRLVDAMDGTVELRHSSPGGSIFAVELPFTEAEENPFKRSETAPVVRSVVTDDSLIARSWEPWCTAAGVEFSCLPWDEILSNVSAFDLIITTDERTIEHSESVSLLVVGSLSVYRNRQSGRHRQDTFALEPVPTDFIQETLLGTSQSVPDPPPAEESLNLLVVDDDKSNLVFHKKLLETHGHQVVTAVGGDEALRVLQEKTFDVAVLDIEMPGMDGWELARRIRSGVAGERSTSLPLVALSGHAARDIADRAAKVGFNEVMTKPVQVDTMNRILHAVAETREDQAPEISAVREIRQLIEAGDYTSAQESLTVMKQQSSQTGVVETAFRLLLALRRHDTQSVTRLVAELEKETDI